MECMKHPGKPMNMVCGEPVCGMCYAESLPSLPRSPKFSELPDMTMIGGHRHPALVKNNE
jgi:hypothetical protein